MSQIKTAITAALLALLLSSGCTPFVGEMLDSSGCMFTSGGPYGVTFGSVTVCRSGKDKATVIYQDKERSIMIDHSGAEPTKPATIDWLNVKGLKP